MGHKEIKKSWISPRFLIFSFGGTIVFLYEILATILLTEFLGVWHMYSYAFALISGLILLLLFHTYVTFGHNCLKLKCIRRFLITYGFAYLISWPLVLSLTQMGLHYLVSIIVISAMISLASYYFNKNWVFKKIKILRKIN
ncbi:hypothetical protein COV12_03070 [Candidatus Woesearchaeota archaeon CG10_big_fil_rev_8_21_14_0_10_32_24]|nr:MAG: hypothetical protein COV12_03070 [Candidatus Woesearchaeota archaeon CG10_big_fil_rev_8_21_14_0_10_32_24]